MSVLTMLAEHNEWANRRIFAACSELDAATLNRSADAYGSAIEILTHLVQVEHSFFELAHGRAPGRIELDELAALREECARIDRDYVSYARELDPGDAETKRFLIPWFGFEITLAEGLLQPLTHSHKHRADVSMLLPVLGGSGIEMDLIQWLDEERGER